MDDNSVLITNSGDLHGVTEIKGELQDCLVSHIVTRVKQ